jgi:hypothetical protein
VEPGLNLAALYVEKKTSLDVNWATRAERLLLDIQTIDPKNTRNLVLLGELYANPVFGRTDDAKKLFTQALPDPEAGRRLGGLCFAEGDPAGAIAPLLSSVAQDSMGSGQLLLTRCALALPTTDRRKCELLRTCQKWLIGMERETGARSNSKSAASLLPKVQAAIDECSKEPVAQASKANPTAQPVLRNNGAHIPAANTPAAGLDTAGLDTAGLDTAQANAIVLACCAGEFPNATLSDTVGRLYPSQDLRSNFFKCIVEKAKAAGFAIDPTKVPVSDADTLATVSASLLASTAAPVTAK